MKPFIIFLAEYRKVCPLPMMLLWMEISHLSGGQLFLKILSHNIVVKQLIAAK